MRRAHYDRILAGTALALMATVPFGSMLTDPVQLTATPPAWVRATPTEPATALPANELGAAAAGVRSLNRPLRRSRLP